MEVAHEEAEICTNQDSTKRHVPYNTLLATTTIPTLLKLANKKKTCCIKNMLHQNMSHQNVYDPTGLHETPPLWLFTVSNTVSNTQFFATPASPSLTRSGSADSFASNHVWEETLEKVFRTKQPTLHAISALFPLSHVVLKVVAFLGVRHFDWGHLHVNAPSDPDGHSGIGGVFWMPMDDVLFLPCARHKCPEATGSNRPFVCRYSCDKGRG